MNGKTPNNICQGKDAFERMNFLYQAGTLMSSTNPVLSCYYGQLCRAVAKKAVIRMEPAIKRTICKRCGLILSGGTTADIRMDATNPKLCEIECSKCGFVRRFTLNAQYKSWLDQADCVKETLRMNCHAQVKVCAKKTDKESLIDKSKSKHNNKSCDTSASHIQMNDKVADEKTIHPTECNNTEMAGKDLFSENGHEQISSTR